MAGQNPSGRQFEYRPTADGGVDLYVNGEPARPALRPMRPKAAAQGFADELNRALRLGAAHGPCDTHREIADALAGRETPGHVVHFLRLARTPVARRDGRDEPVCVPHVRPLSRRVEFVNELGTAFRLGGEARPGSPPGEHEANAETQRAGGLNEIRVDK